MENGNKEQVVTDDVHINEELNEEALTHVAGGDYGQCWVFSGVKQLAERPTRTP